MKIRKVIDPKNLPSSPIRVLQTSGVLWLFLDRFHAPGWVHGMVWTIMTILFFATSYAVSKEIKSTPAFLTKNQEDEEE